MPFIAKLLLVKTALAAFVFKVNPSICREISITKSSSLTKFAPFPITNFPPVIAPPCIDTSAFVNAAS